MSLSTVTRNKFSFIINVKSILTNTQRKNKYNTFTTKFNNSDNIIFYLHNSKYMHTASIRISYDKIMLCD